MKRIAGIALLMAHGLAALAQTQTQSGTCRAKHHGLRSGGRAATDVDVVHYGITVDSLNFTTHLMRGNTVVRLHPTVAALSEVQLSLAGPTTDSVLLAGTSLGFTHLGEALTIQLPASLALSDTVDLTVYYHGQPAQDPSGWGGFYWSGNYAFNLGVGFEVDPHVYGRAWFPCNDVFTDRATYSFHIKAPTGSSAFCNGVRDSVQTLPWGATIHHWHIDQTMPTYLACMAVAPYHWLERNYQGIPAVWAALPADTNAVLSTFQHMPEAVSTFVNDFGPYPWPRIGYSLIPFNSGAMEHASSIHIGKAFVDGSLSYETLWAHELSHMWWGDLVTCSTEQDMWLNEGFAVFAEALFTEAVYGHDAYLNFLRPLHRKVLQFTHVDDAGYFAMDQVPHAVTYGSTVYEKGPLIAHTLRGYMGDAAYFNACRQYMDSLSFGNATSYDLRDQFEFSSGQDLTGFFDGWVFQPGFPHFEVDSFSVASNGTDFSVDLHLRQKSRGNSHVYDVRVPVTFINGNQRQTEWFQISAPTAQHETTLAFNPKWIIVDGDEQMADALADTERKLGSTGTFGFNRTNVSLTVANAGADSSVVRISDHFVAADPITGPIYGHTINPYHYWTLEGEWADGFVAQASFKYDGTTSTSTGYMDNDLITFDEDSLVMVYRPSPGHNWEFAQHQTLIPGTITNNKRGEVKVDSVRIGQYALAQRDYSSAINAAETEPQFQLSPNPTNGSITLIWGDDLRPEWLEVIASDGRIALQQALQTKNQRCQVDVSNLAAGVYTVVLSGQGKKAVQLVTVQ